MTDVKKVVVQVMLKSLIVNIINANAPQLGCEAAVKENFWLDFDTLMIGIFDCEKVLMGGDFNVHIGLGNEDYERVHGGWGFENRNVGDDSLLQFALSLNLAMVNTWFQKMDEHLIIYKSGNHRAHIDYHLIRSSKLTCVKTVWWCPAENNSAT